MPFSKPAVESIWRHTSFHALPRSISSGMAQQLVFTELNLETLLICLTRTTISSDVLLGNYLSSRKYIYFFKCTGLIRCFQIRVKLGPRLVSRTSRSRSAEGIGQRKRHFARYQCTSRTWQCGPDELIYCCWEGRRDASVEYGWMGGAFAHLKSTKELEIEFEASDQHNDQLIAITN